MARIDVEDRKLALAQHLGVEVTEIEEDYRNTNYRNTNFKCESERGEWLVLTDDEADERAKRYVFEALNDIGIEGMNDPEYLIENYSDYDWKYDMHESNLIYALDIQSDSAHGGYANRLVEEAIDRKVIKEKDCFENEDGDLDYDDLDQLAEDLADDMDKDYDSMADYFESIYGRNWVKEADFLKDYINFDGVADYIIDNDGRAVQLASYDGEENEEKIGKEIFYIYRVN